MMIRHVHTLLVGLGLVVQSLPARQPTLAPADRESEVAWLSSLGLTVPAGGPLLEAPFDEPLTKRSFLVPTAWWRAPAPTEVSANDLRQDLPLLHVLMEKAYGGWASAKKRGWDWDKWFADWDQDLASKNGATIPIAEALAAVNRLENFQLDNHTGPTGGKVSFQSGSRTAVLEKSPAATCTELRDASGAVSPLDAIDPAQRPKKARIGGLDRTGSYISYPTRRGAITAIHCGEWIGVTPVWDGPTRDKLIADLTQPADPDDPSYRTISAGIGYLRLPDFSKQGGEKLRRLLPTLPATAGHEKLLIVDLRGNDGGDAPVESISRWLDMASIRAALKFSKIQPNSCVYDALRFAYTQVTSQNLKPPLTPELQKSLQAQLDSLFTPSPPGCPVRIDEIRSDWGYTKHDPQATPPSGHPRLLIIVDHWCGSDCEGLASILAATPGSLVVGENTYGVGQFIQPGYFILPRSKIKFRIALGMSDIYGDARSFDGYGLDVDVVLSTEESQSAAFLLRLAERLAS
jgi:hypothetical protein